MTCPLETSAGWLLVQRRMLDESSLELDSFLWFDLSFLLGVLAPLVSLWVLDSPLFLFLGSGSHQSLFLFSGGSVSHGPLVCFFFGNRESRIALSQLAMRGSGWALDTGIVFFSSRVRHGSRSCMVIGVGRSIAVIAVQIT